MEGLGIHTLWDVFGRHVEKVPSEEVFATLNANELEAFTQLKYFYV